MGLSVNTGPSWKEDSHGYINRATTEINIQKRKTCYDDEGLMLTNPNIACKKYRVFWREYKKS